MEKLITLDEILSYGPCPGYNTADKIIAKTDANWPKPAHEMWGLPIRPVDIFWVISRPGLIFDKTTLSHISCDIAESVLHFYESKCPSDDRPHNAIASNRMWLDGLVSTKEMNAARAAAFAAARAAAHDAADRAARAAYAAAYNAAYDARATARAAAHDAGVEQWKKNLDIAKGYLK